MLFGFVFVTNYYFSFYSSTAKYDSSHLIYDKPSLDIKELDSIHIMKYVLSGDTD